MVSLFIFVFSGVALVRFAMSQWRAIWIASANQPLSESLQLAAGIEGEHIGAHDFDTLMGLCDQLSPDLKKSSPWLKEVSMYYRAVAKLEQLCGLKLAPVSRWATREMQTCSRYVAVALDQTLALNADRRLASRAS
jgi:hypothetical protein